MTPDDVSELVEELEDVIEGLSPAAQTRGQGFFEGSLDAVRSIAETVEKTDRVTDKQAGALRNISSAIQRWADNDD